MPLCPPLCRYRGRTVRKLRRLFLAAVTIAAFCACSPGHRTADFDPRTCLDIIPRKVDGLQILAGPRPEANIIHDMVPAICNGQALFQQMQAQESGLNAGTVRFKVVVEYTGEVNAVSIEETTLTSRAFLQTVSDFIMDSDFTPWARSDEDSVFIYPARFGS
jgi:hypothetical protein